MILRRAQTIFALGLALSLVGITLGALYGDTLPGALRIVQMVSLLAGTGLLSIYTFHITRQKK